MGKFTVELTDDNFEEKVLKSEVPVLVDFWAEWCGPCKMIAPSLEQIAEEKNGALIIGKLDVDSHSNSSMTYGIRSIPTLLLFKNGEIVEKIVGAVAKPKLQKIVEKHL